MATPIQARVAPGVKGETRRSWFIAAIYSMWGVITAALAVPASAYLLHPPKVRGSEEWIDIGDITTLVPDRPVEMAVRHNRADGWKIISEKVTAWVVKTRSQGVVAFGPQCTHLGCAHHWEEGMNRFVCPCHNSQFSIDGSVTVGPAPRPLDRYDVKIEGTKLLLGSLQRKSEQAS